MKKNMNENFEITVDEMTEIFGDTPVEMSFREVKEGMDRLPPCPRGNRRVCR